MSRLPDPNVSWHLKLRRLLLCVVTEHGTGQGRSRPGGATANSPQPSCTAAVIAVAQIPFADFSGTTKIG